MLKILIIIFLITFSPTHLLCLEQDISPDDVINIDPGLPAFNKYPFQEINILEPNKSDFSILNQIFMSNANGERWATITLKNLSSGQRIFSTNQLIAVFADGTRSYPEHIELKLSGNEVSTFVFYFGKHKFPILYIYTRN